METRIQNFGQCSIPSPANYEYYTSDSSRLIFKTVFQSEEDWNSYVKGNPDFFEQAGPREKIYFSPKEVTAGIVTCGGLCPGINDVIRGIVMELYYRYGVSRILGFPYGYQGLVKNIPTNRSNSRLKKWRILRMKVGLCSLRPEEINLRSKWWIVSAFTE